MRTAPRLVSSEHALVRGRVWEGDRIALVFTEFLRQFAHRFGEGIRDDMDSVLELMRIYLRAEIGAVNGGRAALTDGWETVRIGSYRCEIRLFDAAPHYHPETNEFHNDCGNQYSYEINNVPTIGILPKDNTFFSQSDDTRELRTFLLEVAPRIGLVVTNPFGSLCFMMTPAPSYFQSRQQEILIHFTMRKIGDSCNREPPAHDDRDN